MKRYSQFLRILILASCVLPLQAQTNSGTSGAASTSIRASRSGGTVVVSIALSDGLVMAADSRLTITYPTVSPGYKIASDYAPKLFSLGRIAIATYGEAFVSGRSISSYISEFDASLRKPNAMDLDETAKDFSAFFGKYYDKQQPGPTATLPIGFIFAGYDKNGVGKLLEISFPNSRESLVQHNTNDSQGAIWRGQTDVIVRLIKGYDPLFGNLPTILAMPDDKKNALGKEIGQIEYSIPFQYMMLQDGIDFALTLVQTTVDMQRFSFGTAGSNGSIPGVGGTVDVLVVTPTELTWVRRKSLTAK
jgi:hypothetical protein